MEQYIGMNFKKWCALDEDDERPMHITLEKENEILKFESNEEYYYSDFQLIRKSTITDIQLIDEEWYIKLKIL